MTELATTEVTGSPESINPAYGPIDLVILQATSFCNLDCDYCYLPDRTVKTVFDLDLIEPIFTEIFTSPYLDEQLTICWHAGEPLAVPRSFYEEAAKRIARVGHGYNNRNCWVRHSLQTNGTLINQSWCDLFIEQQIEVGVSLDGPAFIHDAHRKTRRGTGTHANVMRGIEFLQRNEIEFYVICVITQESLDHPDELFSFFVENGIRNIGFNIEELEGIHTTSSLASRDAEARYKQFIERFWDLISASNGALNLREFERIGTVLYGDCGYLRSGLTTPFVILNFDVQGNFTTFDPELLGVKTEEYGDFILGNIRHDTLDSILKTEKFRRIYEDIKAGVTLCRKTCQYFKVCGGGSACNKYWENGTFRSTETMACRLYEQIITDVVLEKFEASLGLVEKTCSALDRTGDA